MTIWTRTFIIIKIGELKAPPVASHGGFKSSEGINCHQPLFNVRESNISFNLSRCLIQDNPVGSGTGKYKNERLFQTKPGYASLVPVMGLIREDEFTNSCSEGKG